MKERLTVYTKTGWALKLDDPQNEIEARQQLMQKFRIACDKLAKFEDLMEKHNFESVEELVNYIKKLELKKFRADLVNNVSPVLLSYTEYVQKVFEKIDQQIKKLEEI